MPGKRGKQKRTSEAQADAIIARHAPKWREHLADPHVLEHVVTALSINRLLRKRKKQRDR